jgi:hypothetical protein
MGFDLGLKVLTEAVVVGMVEILLVNFYVYSNVVAILLPCYH